MVVVGTRIGISDNTGIKRARIIRVGGTSANRFGDHVLGVILVYRRLRKNIKHIIHHFLLFSLRRKIFRKQGGFHFYCFRNLGVTTSADFEKLLGSRCTTFLTLESRWRIPRPLRRSIRIIV